MDSVTEETTHVVPSRPPAGRAGHRPRILYLSFYFPPSRASGVFRARATANHLAAAMTPAAGPDNAVRTGNLRAIAVDITPPLDCTMWNWPAKASALNASCSLPR